MAIKNNKVVTTAILAVVLSVSALTQATYLNSGTLYKTVHKDGTVTFSDQPSPGAIEVQLDVPTSTIQSTPPVNNIQTSSNKAQNLEYTVSILNPKPEATIRNNMGELSIGATIEPATGGFFQLQINSEIHESATGIFKLYNMNRGTYEYTVKFINNSGKVIASSEPRKLYLHQASALMN